MAPRRLADKALQPKEFAFTAENLGVGARPDRQISGRAPGFGRHSAAVARPGAGRWLGPRGGDPLCRRHARHGAYPRARGRDLLHDVQPGADRALARAAVRHDAVRAARRERIEESLPRPHRRPDARDTGRQVLMDRGRVPRRLRQRPDGADQLRFLRGPHGGEPRPHPRRARRPAVSRSRARRSTVSSRRRSAD